MSRQISIFYLCFALTITVLFCSYARGECPNTEPFDKGTNMFKVLTIAALGEVKTLLQLCNYKPIENYVTLWCTNSDSPLYYEVPLKITNGRDLDPENAKIMQKHIKFNGKIAFIVHGYSDYPKFNDKAWMKMTGLKVAAELNGTACLVGYKEICDCAYSQVVNQIVPAVARGVAMFINALSRYFNVQPDKNVFLIGHSIGGQIIGFIGKGMNVKPYMILALDPAGLLFTRNLFGSTEVVDEKYRLAPTDGINVIAIHTEYVMFGTSQPLARTDIFINNGLQPGCILPGCNHARVLYYHYATLETVLPVANGPNTAGTFSWGIKYPPPPPGVYQVTINFCFNSIQNM